MPETDPRASRLLTAIADADSIQDAAAVLLGSESLVHALLDTVPVLMWSANPDGEPSYLNQRVVDYTGRSLTDFAMLGWTQLIHPDDLDETVRAWTNAVETGSSYSVKHRLRRADGQFRWFLVRGEPLRNAEGRVVQFFGLDVDITEQEQLTRELRKSEEELRQSEERYALALIGSNEGVFDWDLRAGRTYFHPRTQELLGIPVGEPWRSNAEWDALLTYHFDERERMQAALSAHFASRVPYDHELRFVMPGGQVRWFRARGTALRSADGAPYRFVGSLGDITERKRQQDEVSRLESRLRQAERFEAMGTLAGGIAHDFNNILGAILGFGERALRAAPDGSRMHHDLSNVVLAGERGRALVDRILSFSRGTAGERVPVDAERVVREALDFLQAKLPPRLKLRARLLTGRAAILGDAVQMHQLVMNLCMNAAHAMTQPGLLSVSLEIDEVPQSRQVTVGSVEAGKWIVLRVADQGSGMTPDVLEHIFEPFFTTKEMGVGTGLGLPMVLRIVAHFAGAIDVESTPGAGSTFTVYLPHAGEAPAESASEPAMAPRGRGQRVMIVEDEVALLELTADALRDLGYAPVAYESALAALECFSASPASFAALVTDLQMPGMSGDALVQKVRAMSPLLPVILVSAYAGDGARSPFDSYGWADEVLTKPLRRDALATSLARLLDIT